MESSTVRWFNNATGFGFTTVDRDDDSLVQFSEVHANGFKSLRKNQRVSYHTSKGLKKLQTSSIRST